MQLRNIIKVGGPQECLSVSVLERWAIRVDLRGTPGGGRSAPALSCLSLRRSVEMTKTSSSLSLSDVVFGGSISCLLN